MVKCLMLNKIYCNYCIVMYVLLSSFAQIIIQLLTSISVDIRIYLPTKVIIHRAR